MVRLRGLRATGASSPSGNVHIVDEVAVSPGLRNRGRHPRSYRLSAARNTYRAIAHRVPVFRDAERWALICRYLAT